MSEFTVRYICGVEIMPLKLIAHRLLCERPGACMFNECNCAPRDRVLPGKLSPSYEAQVEAKRARKSR